MSKRPRVLLIAELANPEWVSVPLEGWSHASAIRKLADVHVVTHWRNEGAIDRAGWQRNTDGAIGWQEFEGEPGQLKWGGSDYSSINTEWVSRPLENIAQKLRGGQNKGWTTITAFSSIAYYDFERQVAKQFGKAIRAGEFDVVHRLTPLSPTASSYSLPKLCRKAGVPFMVGPLNGGVPWPEAFDAVRRQEKEWLSYVRDAYRLLPGYKLTRKAAAAVLVGSKDTMELEPQWAKDQFVYVPENAVEPERFAEALSEEPGPASLPLKLAFVGRLVPYKGADMLIDAAAELAKAGQVEVNIYGDGPEMPRLKQMVADHGIESNVHLHGWVEHTELNKHLRSNHLFTFPSIREFGGAVCLEAMISGVVPVVVAYGGPAELVTPATGYTVPIGTRDSIVAGMKQHLETLVADPSVIQPLAVAGRARVLKHFTWDAKAAMVLESYRWVMGERDRPEYSIPLED